MKTYSILALSLSAIACGGAVSKTPAPAASSELSQSCSLASDCHGVLPHSVVNGVPAHFACDTSGAAGVCVVSYDQVAGNTCGGFVANAKKCDPGLNCDHVGTNPDASGICVVAPVAQSCDSAWDCDLTDDACIWDGSCHMACDNTHGAGKCTISFFQQEGDVCGGFKANAPKCDVGLACDHTGRNPDGYGVCVQAAPGCGQASDCSGVLPQSIINGVKAHWACDASGSVGQCVVSYGQAEGQGCGGFVANAKKCDVGLSCQLGKIPDAGGVCVR